MDSMPAKDFLDKYVSAYGETWSSTFGWMVEGQPSAKHMAAFIDDLEIYGQQNPVLVDKSGMVSEGHRRALALNVLGADIEYSNIIPAAPRKDQVWYAEFHIDSQEDEDNVETFLDAYLSFRIDDDWVEPTDAGFLNGLVVVEMFVPSGEPIARRLDFYITERLKVHAGVDVGTTKIMSHSEVDEDAE